MRSETYYGQVTDIYEEDGILFQTVKDDVIIFDLENTKKYVADRKAFAKGKNYPVVLDVNNAQSFNMEAQKYEATDEGLEGLLALASIVRSKLQQILGNIYIMIQKPKVPNKLFSDRESAIEWVKQYKEKEQVA